MKKFENSESSENSEACDMPNNSTSFLPQNLVKSVNWIGQSTLNISNQILPFDNPLIIPSSDSMTLEQALGEGKQVIIIVHLFT